MKNKTKQITKDPKSKKGRQQKQKPITNQQGDPFIQHLNDFVTSIKNTYTSKPIYTGGRILIMNENIYASCNSQICIVKHHAHNKNSQIQGQKQSGLALSHQQLIAHKNQEIINFCVCPQQKFIVTFTQNSLLRLMVIQTKKILYTIKISGAFANDLAFSPDGRYLACAFGNQVQIFTVQNLKRTHSYYPSGNNNKFVVSKLKWHPQPQSLQLITCDLQRTIVIFDYILNKVIISSEANEGGSDFCLSENGSNLYAINNQEIRCYQTRNLKLQYRIPTQQYMESICILDDILYFGGQTTQLISIDCRRPDSEFRQHKKCTDNGVHKIIPIVNGTNKSLFVLSFQQNISILRLTIKNSLKFQGMIIGYNDEIIDIKCSKNPEEIQKYFILVTNSSNVKVMNISTHKLQYMISGHSETVLCAQYWHPFIITAGKDKQMKLWKINDQSHKVDLLGNYHGHSGDIVSLCFLPNNHKIATISDDNTLKLWPLISPSLQESNNSVIQIRSSLHTVPAHAKSINSVKVNSNEQYIATCSQDKTIKIWDLTLNNLMELNGHRKGVWDIAFHQREKLLVSVGGQGMIKGWNLLTGQNIWSMGQGQALIRCSWIYYNQVVTGSADGIVKIWDIRKMTSLTYDKHEGKIWALDVYKNKNNKARIYTGATDSVYHVWDDNTSQIKGNIMHKNQLEQQQRVFYSQHMADKNYSEAALVAFKGGYTKLFLQVLQKLFCSYSPEKSVTFTQDEQIKIEQQQLMEQQLNEQQIKQFVRTLKDTNIDYLLNSLKTMNSTIKYYKIANKMLQILLQILTIQDFMKLNKNFALKEDQDIEEIQVGEKKTGFHKWLQNMIANTSKHTSRVGKYIKDTYWIDHLKRVQNPFIN